MVVADDWAFRRATIDWTIAPVAGGEGVRDSGKFVILYKRVLTERGESRGTLEQQHRVTVISSMEGRLTNVAAVKHFFGCGFAAGRNALAAERRRYADAGTSTSFKAFATSRGPPPSAKSART